MPGFVLPGVVEPGVVPGDVAPGVVVVGVADPGVVVQRDVVIASVSSVTEPFRASTRPSIVTPVVTVMLPPERGPSAGE